jgi:hypothetical protein
VVNRPKEDEPAPSAQKARLGLRLAGRLGSWLRQRGRIGVWLRLGLDHTGRLGVTGRLSLVRFPLSPLSLAVMLGTHVSLSLSTLHACPTGQTLSQILCGQPPDPVRLSSGAHLCGWSKGVCVCARRVFKGTPHWPGRDVNAMLRQRSGGDRAREDRGAVCKARCVHAGTWGSGAAVQRRGARAPSVPGPRRGKDGDGEGRGEVYGMAESALAMLWPRQGKPRAFRPGSRAYACAGTQYGRGRDTAAARVRHSGEAGRQRR